MVKWSGKQKSMEAKHACGAKSFLSGEHFELLTFLIAMVPAMIPAMVSAMVPAMVPDMVPAMPIRPYPDKSDIAPSHTSTCVHAVSSHARFQTCSAVWYFFFVNLKTLYLLYHSTYEMLDIVGKRGWLAHGQVDTP